MQRWAIQLVLVQFLSKSLRFPLLLIDWFQHFLKELIATSEGMPHKPPKCSCFNNANVCQWLLLKRCIKFHLSSIRSMQILFGFLAQMLEKFHFDLRIHTVCSLLSQRILLGISNKHAFCSTLLWRHSKFLYHRQSAKCYLSFMHCHFHMVFTLSQHAILKTYWIRI